MPIPPPPAPRACGSWRARPDAPRGTAPSSRWEPAQGDPTHNRSGYELGAVAVVAFRRVAGGLRRAMAVTGAVGFTVVGALLLAFPRVAGIVLAAGSFSLALAFALYAFERRRTR